MKFEEANSIYNSDSHRANLLRNCEAQNSTFHLKNVPSIDIELMPRSANVSKTLAARITNPLSCSSILDKLTRRRDDDYDPGGGRAAGHYMPAPPIQSVNVATAVQSNQVNTQKSANGYTKKLKMSLTEATELVFNIIKIPSFFLWDGSYHQQIQMIIMVISDKQNMFLRILL